MHYTNLGRTGLRVSKLCLGTMIFGIQCDEAQSHAVLEAAAVGGIDFIDTADVYPLGADLSFEHGRPNRGDRRGVAER
jgi:aryl-alcohol dehydrogenase-like predicted oxidoreductase